MKKIFLLLLFALVSMGSYAQFEKGTKYVGASLTGLNLSYSSGEKFGLGLQGVGGYFFADSWMVTGALEYNHQWQPAPLNDINAVSVGAGARYYFQSNGIFLGAGLKYKHAEDYNDLVPNVHLGYAFFLSRTVTLEPELYFDFSTKSSDNFAYGLRIGIGVYLFKDQYKLKR